MDKNLEEYKKKVEKEVLSQGELQALQRLTEGDWQTYYEENLSPRAVIAGTCLGLL